MDHLFAPFGVALWEGNPLFDVYDGELTYSAVTPNMRDALEWIAGLYEEGLLDPETMLNTGSTWNSKIRSDRVGSWYHGPMWLLSTLSPLAEVNPEVELDFLPVPNASGYESAYTARQYAGPGRGIAAGDEESIIAALQLLEYFIDPANQDAIARGYEGLNYVVEDGEEVRIALPEDLRGPIDVPVISKESQIAQRFSYIEDGELLPLANIIEEIIRDSESRPIAGQGIPRSVFDGYSELANHTMYYEYASLIIIGEYPIERFDEFVERWYAAGGEEVTERAREAYSRIAE
jgi:putative aldouronate transport system substrate-binding protein